MVCYGYDLKFEAATEMLTIFSIRHPKFGELQDPILEPWPFQQQAKLNEPTPKETA